MNYFVGVLFLFKIFFVDVKHYFFCEIIFAFFLMLSADYLKRVTFIYDVAFPEIQ